MALLLRRGIAPELLLSQVRNTLPYLFAEGVDETPLGRLEPAKVLRDYVNKTAEPLSHFDYFRLCMCSHLLSCSTPVPTDVDNQIRRKLWPAELPLEDAFQMTRLVLEARHWDYRLISTRFTHGALTGEWGKEALSGHLGEWFTLAAAAYCALGQYEGAREALHERQAVFAAISSEVHRHSEIFGSLWRAGDGLSCLKASASIAHNFGDLDRVMDMWSLSPGDPLRLEYYKLGIEPFDSKRNLRYLGRLWVAGELYKSPIAGSSMALENHRHYALRKPRALRGSRDFLVPTGPFFDDWGRAVAQGLRTGEGEPSADTHEVVDALTYGWDRQPRSIGYGRGLRGLLEVHPKLDVAAMMKGAGHRAVLETEQSKFEGAWSAAALLLMDEIPSRA